MKKSKFCNLDRHNTSGRLLELAYQSHLEVIEIGRLGGIFKTTDPGVILKLWNPIDTGYSQWVEYSTNTCNPFFPRFYGEVGEFEEFYSVKMEELKPLNRKQSNFLAVYDNKMSRAIEYRDLILMAIDGEDIDDRHMFKGIYDDFEEAFPGLFFNKDFMQVHSVLHIHKDAMDLHSKNVMRRGEQIVFVDPIAHPIT